MRNYLLVGFFVVLFSIQGFSQTENSLENLSEEVSVNQDSFIVVSHSEIISPELEPEDSEKSFPFSLYTLVSVDLKRREGFSSRPYMDGEQWAIGYGQHFKTASDLPKYPITEKKATEIMNKMLEVEYRNVCQQFPNYNPNEKWALTSLVFNVGMTAVRSDSVFWTALKSKNTPVLKEKWIHPVFAKSTNHQKSRELEWAMFINDVDQTSILYEEAVKIVKYRYEKKVDFYEWRTKKNKEAGIKQ